MEEPHFFEGFPALDAPLVNTKKMFADDSSDPMDVEEEGGHKGDEDALTSQPLDPLPCEQVPFRFY